MKRRQAAIGWGLSILLLSVSAAGIIGAHRDSMLNGLRRLYGDVLPRELFPSSEDSYLDSDSLVTFVAHGELSSLFLTPEAAILEFRREQKGVAFQDIAMQIINAEFTPVVGEGEAPDKGSYFVGNYLEQGRDNVRPCARSHQHDILPGVDLIFYPNTSRFQFDFIVAPEADPSKIHLEFVHIDYQEIDRLGNLAVHANGLELFQHAPVTYQEADGERKPVAGAFVVVNEGSDIGFRVGDYDKSLPLVISVR